MNMVSRFFCDSYVNNHHNVGAVLIQPRDFEFSADLFYSGFIIKNMSGDNDGAYEAQNPLHFHLLTLALSCKSIYETKIFDDKDIQLADLIEGN